jgi:hypothetical protein
MVWLPVWPIPGRGQAIVRNACSVLRQVGTAKARGYQDARMTTTPFATLGYGFHREESVFLLDAALRIPDREGLREACVDAWPQRSATNKSRMWIHLANRYLVFEDDRAVATPFLRLFQKLHGNDQAALDLMFFRLCQTTPVVLATLRALTTDALRSTGQASFTKYHLDQLLESIFGRVTKSTCERVRQILIHAGRLKLVDKTYVAMADCPATAVLGYALYTEAGSEGWRAPSSAALLERSDLAAAFLCSRPLLVNGLQSLSGAGHCAYHRHGQTDQIQLIYQDAEEFVDAWQQ